MPVNQDILTKVLSKNFPDAEIELLDLVGDENHYELKIISSAFHGKMRVEQHRMVYDALRDYMANDLHAISINTIAK
jgi:stress-induced morphogen